MLRWTIFLIAVINPGMTLDFSKLLPKDYQAEFSWKFHKKISLNFQTNAASSPYLIRETFACLANVSLPSSSLRKELEKVLLLPKTNLIHTRFDLQRERLRGRNELKITSLAAGLGTRHDLDKKFKTTMKHCRVYQARIPAESSIRMTQMLNAAFQNVSKNEMKTFLSIFDFNDEWDFVIMNSVVMNPPWKYMFKEKDTTVCPFYVSKSEQIYTEFMEVEEHFNYGRFPQWNLVAVEVPFRDSSPFSCVLMHSIDGSLSNMMKNFSNHRFREIFQKMKEGKTTVIVPKGPIRLLLKAGNILQYSGLKTPFTENLFKVYNSPSGLPLGDFLQKIKINFETGVGQQEAETIPGRDLGNQFHADQPFVYVIFDHKELMPIIVGHMARPIKSNKPKSHHLRCQKEPAWAKKG